MDLPEGCVARVLGPEEGSKAAGAVNPSDAFAVVLSPGSGSGSGSARELWAAPAPGSGLTKERWMAAFAAAGGSGVASGGGGGAAGGAAEAPGALRGAEAALRGALAALDEHEGA